jgi:hypothetical protein
MRAQKDIEAKNKARKEAERRKALLNKRGSNMDLDSIEGDQPKRQQKEDTGPYTTDYDGHRIGIAKVTDGVLSKKLPYDGGSLNYNTE